MTESDEIVLESTISLIERMMLFWKNVRGWAPENAAALLNRSVLEHQASLAVSLRLWKNELTNGELILAWANLGALVEGQLKLFLSVYYNDYKSDMQGLEFTDPDALMLEKLRQFFAQKIWTNNEKWNAWILLIQQRRNAIHAFKFREIGDSDEFHSQLLIFNEFVNEINDRLPYPDSSCYP